MREEKHQETKNIEKAKAGFRKKLPGEAVYVIYPIIYSSK